MKMYRTVVHVSNFCVKYVLPICLNVYQHLSTCGLRPKFGSWNYIALATKQHFVQWFYNRCVYLNFGKSLKCHSCYTDLCFFYFALYISGSWGHKTNQGCGLQKWR